MAAPRARRAAPARWWACAWAAPCTALGLGLALPLWLLGAVRLKVVQGVIEAAPRRPAPGAGGFVAITLGHLVLARCPAQLQRLRAHERAHVAQYERWGVVFLAAYPLASLWMALRGRDPYHDNPFEVQARRAELAAPGPCAPRPPPACAVRREPVELPRDATC